MTRHTLFRRLIGGTAAIALLGLSAEAAELQLKRVMLSAGGVAAPEPVQPTVGKVVTFKLGATGEIPDVDIAMVDPTPKTDPFGTEDQIADGLVHYARNCTVCHGPFAMGAGVLPDLRWSSYTSSADAWKGVVIDGNLQSLGMVSFADVLSEDEVEAIRAYVVHQAHNTDGIEAAIANEGGGQ